MRIDQLVIENFRKFDNRTFNFDPHFNLLIGVNGSGKTSILDALAVALAGWTYAFVPGKSNRRLINDAEIRVIENKMRFTKMYPARIEAIAKADVIVDGAITTETVKWWRKKDETKSTISSVLIRKGKKSTRAGKLLELLGNSFDFKKFGQELLKTLGDGGDFTLPLIAYYQCDRLWLPSLPSIENAAKTQYSHFTPYGDCFHTAFNSKQLKEWLLKQELIKLQKKKISVELSLVKKALVNCLENCSGISFDMEESRVIVEYEDGSKIPYDCLSDGQRIMFAMISDLVFRATILNPHLGKKALDETPGVVLIDELDLHLHPKWQRRVIKDLRRTFPKVQFICTTHSPQLIGQAKADEIILLDSITQKHPGQSFGMDSNWILRHVMGGDDRDPNVATKLDTIFEDIEESRFPEAEKAIETLRAEIGPHPDLVEAEALISRYTRFSGDEAK